MPEHAESVVASNREAFTAVRRCLVAIASRSTVDHDEDSRHAPNPRVRTAIDKGKGLATVDSIEEQDGQSIVLSNRAGPNSTPEGAKARRASSLN